MSHDATEMSAIPHEPTRGVPVEHQGFESNGGGRDIFFAAVETTRMPMVVADPRLPDVPIVFANNAFLEMTGYSYEEIVGRNCRFLQGPDTDRSTVAAIHEAVVAEKEITVELLNYRKDGTTFWNALFMTPLRSPQGELLYFFSSQMDITRRKDAETALQHAQKMEALGQLTGGIAHDFNNLLQIIIGNVDVAKVLTRPFGNKQVERSLDNARQAAQKSGALTQQLLAFARKQQLQGRVINLSEHADHLADLVQRTLGGDITLKRNFGRDLWNARIDPTQAEVALLNLIVNARDAINGGGAVILGTDNLSVADEQEAARHGVPRPGRYVVLSVTDSGRGIPAAILPRVMDPFFTTKPVGEGTGLGLSMVYGFAKQSGGVVTIYSEEGHGTTVRVYFPATDDVSTRPRQTSTFRRDGSERILIVDDRPEIAEMAALILGQSGYECVEANSADAALTVLEAAVKPFDLILTDLIMPGGMNGVLLAREAQRRQPGLKVLLMTGFADGTPNRWGGEHFDIIFKPYSADDLQSKVRLALDGSNGVS